MSVNLTVLDRLLLLNMLPAQGSVTTLQQVKAVREKVSFTDEEVETFELVETEGQVRWNVEKAVELGVTFTPKQEGVIVDALKKADSASTLTEQHLPLWEKFCGEE